MLQEKKKKKKMIERIQYSLTIFSYGGSHRFGRFNGRLMHLATTVTVDTLHFRSARSLLSPSLRIQERLKLGIRFRFTFTDKEL